MTKILDKRPAWPAYFKISEADARWLNHNIVKIEHGWEFTSEDTSRDWIDCYVDDGYDPPVVPARRRFNKLPEHVRFAPDHAGLLELDSSVEDVLRAMDEWDATHRRELAELKRLQDKLGVERVTDDQLRVED
jgi:hypothetical protein